MCLFTTHNDSLAKQWHQKNACCCSPRGYSSFSYQWDSFSKEVIDASQSEVTAGPCEDLRMSQLCALTIHCTQSSAFSTPACPKSSTAMEGKYCIYAEYCEGPDGILEWPPVVIGFPFHCTSYINGYISGRAGAGHPPSLLNREPRCWLQWKGLLMASASAGQRHLCEGSHRRVLQSQNWKSLHSEVLLQAHQLPFIKGVMILHKIWSVSQEKQSCSSSLQNTFPLCCFI